MRHIIKVMVATVLFALLPASGAGAARDTLARQVLAEVNLARTQPQRYAENLRRLARMFEGKGYREPGSGVLIITTEGVDAVEEAITFLSRQSPLPPLTWSPGLAKAAAELVREQGRTGEVGHGQMQRRIERQGTWRRRIAENIGYGSNTARLVVMELIVDDGVSERGHRKNIFTRDFSVAGVACGRHPRYRTMCVMDFAGAFSGRGKKR